MATTDAASNDDDHHPTSADYVQLNILTFAAVRDRLQDSSSSSNVNVAAGDPGANQFQVRLPSSWSSGADLRRHICRQLWPVLAEIEPSIALALNLQYVDLNGGPLTLTAADTLALIPPISGG